MVLPGHDCAPDTGRSGAGRTPDPSRVPECFKPGRMATPNKKVNLPDGIGRSPQIHKPPDRLAQSEIGFEIGVRDIYRFGNLEKEEALQSLVSIKLSAEV